MVECKRLAKGTLCRQHHGELSGFLMTEQRPRPVLPGAFRTASCTRQGQRRGQRCSSRTCESPRCTEPSTAVPTGNVSVRQHRSSEVAEVVEDDASPVQHGSTPHLQLQSTHLRAPGAFSSSSVRGCTAHLGLTRIEIIPSVPSHRAGIKVEVGRKGKPPHVWKPSSHF